jgi:formylglycine-generating enzyme required for sulfatase activity
MTPQRENDLKQELKKLRPDLSIGERLGDGSFSITLAATSGKVPCAVKFSKESLRDDPAVVRERDACISVMLSCNGHPHIATLHYIAEVQGHLATVWERGDRSLDDRLSQCQAEGLPAIPGDELIGYIIQAADGLDFMHGKGIVHRDIKPENVLMFRNEVKLIDFGFARVAELRSTVNSAKGTPVYAPPEAGDERVTLNPAYDIYSLAAMAIRLLTGQFPFGRGDDMRQRKLRGEFHSLGLPSAVSEVLRGALSADPRGRRYGLASDFAMRLSEAWQSESASGKSRGSAGPSAGSSAKSAATRGATAANATAADATAADATGRDSRFVDLVDRLRQREVAELEGEKNKHLETRRRQREAFDRQLERYVDKDQLPLAYGTVLALLRDDAANAKYQQLKKFLEEKNPKTGRPRCCDTNGQRYALIPDGEFMMGSSESPAELKKAFPNGDLAWFEREWPRHRVVITQPFFLALYPTTVGQWREFVQATGYVSEGEKDGKGGWGLTSEGKWEQKPEFVWHSPGFPQGPDHPVTLVSRNDVAEFLKWHRGLTGFATDFPTEAQWEYACRAGTTPRHYAGDDLEALARIANVADASAKKQWRCSSTIEANDGYAYTSPVGSFAANPWGLYDLIGNVWEWCHDRFDANYYRSSPTEDPQGPASGNTYVLRGGSWAAFPWCCRSGFRRGRGVSARVTSGFRLCIRLS